MNDSKPLKIYYRHHFFSFKVNRLPHSVLTLETPPMNDKYMSIYRPLFTKRPAYPVNELLL